MDRIIVDTHAAALYAGVDPATIRSWVHRGKLPSYGRHHRRALVDLRDVDRIAPPARETET